MGQRTIYFCDVCGDDKEPTKLRGYHIDVTVTAPNSSPTKVEELKKAVCYECDAEFRKRLEATFSLIRRGKKHGNG